MPKTKPLGKLPLVRLLSPLLVCAAHPRRATDAANHTTSTCAAVHRHLNVIIFSTRERACDTETYIYADGMLLRGREVLCCLQGEKSLMLDVCVYM